MQSTTKTKARTAPTLSEQKARHATVRALVHDVLARKAAREKAASTPRRHDSLRTFSTGHASNKLRELRLRVGMSQYDMAKALGWYDRKGRPQRSRYQRYELTNADSFPAEFVTLLAGIFMPKGISDSEIASLMGQFWGQRFRQLERKAGVERKAG